MSDMDRTAADEQDLRRFWILAGLASIATLVAAVAGMALAIANPDDGSSRDDALRVAAAAGGLAAGALFGASAIWAQVKNLWRFAPRWFRYLAWGVMAVVLIAALVSSAVRSN